jgi:hypothetical protein
LPEIAKVIYDEATFGGRNAAHGKLLVQYGADWQKKRIVAHLQEKLGVAEETLVKIRGASDKNNDVSISDLSRAAPVFEHGAQIELLKLLISELQG